MEEEYIGKLLLYTWHICQELFAKLWPINLQRRNYGTIQLKRKRNITLNLIYICNLAISSMNTKMSKDMGMANISRLVLYMCMCACKVTIIHQNTLPNFSHIIQWEACMFLTASKVWSFDFLKVEVHEKFEKRRHEATHCVFTNLESNLI